MKATITPITRRLYLITLVPPIPGFQEFIGVWLYQGKTSFLVDVGPACTAPALGQALDELGVERLDAILITHIHLDHAGALGELSARFPQAPVVCHPEAIPHLIDPRRLWAGSLKTLGPLARSYGPPKAIGSHCLLDASDFDDHGITTIITPGHSRHHVSFAHEQHLFVGEAAGVHLAAANWEYLRPATPPRFFMDVYLDSLAALTTHAPRNICYGHLGLAQGGLGLLRAHREQLALWRTIVVTEMTASDSSDVSVACLDRLLSEDPCLQNFSRLTPAIQDRERYFLLNSIKGLRGYLQNSVDEY